MSKKDPGSIFTHSIDHIFGCQESAEHEHLGLSVERCVSLGAVKDFEVRTSRLKRIICKAKCPIFKAIVAGFRGKVAQNKRALGFPGTDQRSEGFFP